MTTRSCKINDGLHLVLQSVPRKAKAASAPMPTNHLAVIDCSGSMTYDLPRIREQLKARLPKLLGEGDTISIIWFSGKGQCGTLLELEPVATLADLAEVNRAIDRWLKPIGMTGFREPLEVATDLISGRKRAVNSHPWALFFTSDGCDNQWTRAEILKAVDKAAGGLASATFVEYGYYADRNLLAAMAEKAGGQLIFAEDFDRYSPMFEAAMAKQAIGGKRVEVTIEGDPIGALAWALATGELLTFEAAGKVSVPEHVTEIAYLSPARPDGEVTRTLATMASTRELSYGTVGAQPEHVAMLSHAYAALSVFAVRMKPDVVYPILKALGDVTFINAFSTCFGKQAYTAFMEGAKHAAFNNVARWNDGYDPDRVPPDDAFTVLDLLRLLSSDEDNRLLLDHPSFRYSRVSRRRVDAFENLSTAEQAEVDRITDAMAATKVPAKLKQLKDELDAILATKQDALKFVPVAAPDGYPIVNLTYNEDRPNISVLVRKEGTVYLGKRKAAAIPAGMLAAVPDVFPTFIYRNYTIVRDGLVNVAALPCLVTESTHEALVAAGVRVESSLSTIVTSDRRSLYQCLIDVASLPILNRKMVVDASARSVIELQWQLTKLKAQQKVYNHYRKLLVPKVAKGFVEQYGEPVAAWLKDQGLTDYGGFSPRQVQAASTDFIIGKELTVALKGYSTLPKVEDVLKKLADGSKLNGPGQLMAEAAREVQTFLASGPDKATIDKWLDGMATVITTMTRQLMRQMAQIKMAVIVGQTWFREWKSLDENTLTLHLGGADVVGTISMREVQIDI